MRIKKNYLTLLAITLAVIILCFMLPSALFQFYDTEWTEKRVEKSANVSGLNIDSMSLSEKIQLIYNLDTIEAALNGETDTSLEVAVLSRGYKLTKEEAWSNIITEFMKLADGLPLSPIRPRHSPSSISKETFNTAFFCPQFSL